MSPVNIGSLDGRFYRTLLRELLRGLWGLLSLQTRTKSKITLVSFVTDIVMETRLL